MMITVSLDGNGDFQSIQAAINALEKNKPMTILIKPGTYYEKLHLEHSNLTIIGENPKTTIITFDDYAKKRLSDQTLTQTFRSYTAFIRGNNLTFENITFKNNAGIGKEVGQAIAAYIDGDCLHFKNCHFIAHQDTLFTAPLPPSPLFQVHLSGQVNICQEQSVDIIMKNATFKVISTSSLEAQLLILKNVLFFQMHLMVRVT